MKTINNNSNLKIGSNCINCGTCLALEYPFLQSENFGQIVVKNGTFVDKETIQILNEICPQKCFILDNNISKKILISKLVQELKKQSTIKHLEIKDVPFNINEYAIPIPKESGNLLYRYSTSNAAEEAALKEFKCKMHSQSENILLKIMTEYRVKYFEKYYTLKSEKESVYLLNNIYIENILKSIKKLTSDPLPNDFDTFNAKPDKIMLSIITDGDLDKDNETYAYSEFEGAYARDYDYCWSYNWRDDYVGNTIFGNPKYKTKYCYYGVDKAFSECAKDLKDACYYAKDKIEQRSIEIINRTIDSYNSEVESLIKQKLDLIRS